MYISYTTIQQRPYKMCHIVKHKPTMIKKPRFYLESHDGTTHSPDLILTMKLATYFLNVVEMCDEKYVDLPDI